MAQLEALSFDLERITVVLLDNAPAHLRLMWLSVFKSGRAFGKSAACSFFYLPPYSPHLHIVEVLWRKLKYELKYD